MLKSDIGTCTFSLINIGSCNIKSSIASSKHFYCKAKDAKAASFANDGMFVILQCLKLCKLNYFRYYIPFNYTTGYYNLKYQNAKFESVFCNKILHEILHENNK